MPAPDQRRVPAVPRSDAALGTALVRQAEQFVLRGCFILKDFPAYPGPWAAVSILIACQDLSRC